MNNKFKVITVGVVTNDKNQVLLGKRAETEDVFPGCWGIPGGKVELDGTEKNRNILEQSVQRELEEEVWIQVWKCSYLSSHYWHNWGEFKLYIAFTAQHLSWTPQALDDTEEVKFFDIKEAMALKLAPNIEIILDEVKNFLEKKEG